MSNETELRETFADLASEVNTTRTAREYFDAYVGARNFVPIELDRAALADDMGDAELEAASRDANVRKFLLHMVAIGESQMRLPRKVVHAIERATTLATLDAIAAALPDDSETRHMHRKLAGAPRAEELFDEFQQHVDAFVASLREREKLIELRDGEVRDGKTLTREAVERVKREHGVRVVLPYSHTGVANRFIAGLHEAAQEAAGLIAAGMPIDGDAESHKSALVTAAAALAAYERERPLITRSDGDHLLGVRFNFDDFYARCKAAGYSVTDYRRGQPIEQPMLERFYKDIGGEERAATDVESYNSGRPTIFQVLANMPVLDCAIFVPRLLMVLFGREQTRVVHFAHAYRMYTAAIMTLKATKAAPSQRDVDRRTAEAQKELLRKQKKLGSALVDVPSDWSASVAPTAMRTPSREVIDAAVDQLRSAALREWGAQLDALRAYYALDRRYHRGEMSDAEMALTEHKPSGPSDAADGAPERASAEQLFYRTLWFATQNLCIGLLHAQEIGILMQLQEFFPIEMREHFMTSRELPDERRTSPATAERVQAANANLAARRQLQTTKLHADGIVHSRYDVECRVDAATALHTHERPVVAALRSVVKTPDEDDLAPRVPAELLDAPVNPAQSCSPTFAQMRQFYCDLATLIELEPKQVAYLRQRHGHKKRH
jgi:hypothetical protein